MDDQNFCVVEGTSSRTKQKFRAAVDEQTRLVHYSKERLVADGLTRNEAEALAYFIERKYDMATMKEMVEEYNKLTGKSIKKFADVATAEKRLKEARKAAAPAKAKAPKAEGAATRKGRAPSYTEIRIAKNPEHKLSKNSARAVVMAQIEKDGGASWISADKYDGKVLYQLIRDGHLEAR